VKAVKILRGKMTFAGSATYSAHHAAHERFNLYADTKSTYVPFKGTGEMIQSIIGRHVTGAISYVPLAMQQRMRMLRGLIVGRFHGDCPGYRLRGALREISR